MKIEFEHIDDLIAKYLSGEATKEEYAAIEEWTSSSMENQKYLTDTKTIFVASAKLHELQVVNEEDAWSKVLQRIAKNEEKKPIVRRLPLVRTLQIAATVLVLITTTYFLYHQSSTSDIEKPEVAISTMDHEILKDTLPDGSEVTLNKNSTITIASNFNNNTRAVKLVGEAFFKINHLENKPFVISTSQLFIKDIGTSFNVKSNLNDSVVTVYVEEGEVAFYSGSDPGVILTAGELASYNKLKKIFEKQKNFNQNELFYKNHILKFENTSLKEVFETLNKVYQANIVWSNSKLGNCKLTASFSEDNVMTIVEIISETFDCKITKTDKTILIEGVGCEN